MPPIPEAPIREDQPEAGNANAGKGDEMNKEIRILEDDMYMFTVKVDENVYVYNKEYGIFYNGDEEVHIDPDTVKDIFSILGHVDGFIEDNPDYVYNPDNIWW